MIYLSSDSHYFHVNIIKYSKRPFSSVEEMNQSMIDNWNKTVKNNDTVIHLGDVIFHPDSAQVEKILSQLNGYKHLILGNHDAKIKNKDFFRNIGKQLKIMMNFIILIQNLFYVIFHY